MGFKTHASAKPDQKKVQPRETIERGNPRRLSSRDKGNRRFGERFFGRRRKRRPLRF
jgi:hypothetical protein